MTFLRRTLVIAIAAALACLVAGDPVVEHHLQRGDISLFYETEGKGDPVVLLSGGPGVTPYSVKPVEDFVSQGHEAVLIHQRGTGKTPLPNPDRAHVNLQAFIDDVDAVRQDLHADKITVVGHSWGGMLAMAYAGAHPDRVAKLILLDSGGANMTFAGVFQDNINMHLTADDRALQKQANEEAAQHNPLSSFHYLLSILPGYFYQRDTALDFRKTLKPSDYNPDLRPLLIGFDVTKSLTNYHGPVEIIQGRQDPVDPSTVALNVKYLPQAKVHWVERAGHIPWLEEPAQWQKEMSQALSD